MLLPWEKCFGPEGHRRPVSCRSRRTRLLLPFPKPRFLSVAEAAGTAALSRAAIARRSLASPSLLRTPPAPPATALLRDSATSLNMRDSGEMGVLTPAPAPAPAAEVEEALLPPLPPPGCAAPHEFLKSAAPEASLASAAAVSLSGRALLDTTFRTRTGLTKPRELLYLALGRSSRPNPPPSSPPPLLALPPLPSEPSGTGEGKRPPKPRLLPLALLLELFDLPQLLPLELVDPMEVDEALEPEDPEEEEDEE